MRNTVNMFARKVERPSRRVQTLGFLYLPLPLVEIPYWMAPCGQPFMQAQHLMHLDIFHLGILPSISIAPIGHRSTHLPHFMQLVSA